MTDNALVMDARDLDLDLDGVPVASDFAVELRDRRIELTSGGRRIAWFPAWENADRDLRHFVAADVPIGSIDAPFEDADDQWRILIFECAGWVYVLEGDAPDATTFPRRWRVTRDRYLEGWAALMQSYNPLVPLDE